MTGHPLANASCWTIPDGSNSDGITVNQHCGKRAGHKIPHDDLQLALVPCVQFPERIDDQGDTLLPDEDEQAPFASSYGVPSFLIASRRSANRKRFGRNGTFANPLTRGTAGMRNKISTAGPSVGIVRTDKFGTNPSEAASLPRHSFALTQSTSSQKIECSIEVCVIVRNL
jgi:hypothetical protein